VRGHPDFNSWISGGVRQLVPDSPVATSQIEVMNLDALLAECARLCTLTDPFGDSSKDGFLQEIARTAAANFPWSIAIAEEAAAKAESPTEIRSALLRGWSSAHDLKEWKSLLPMLTRLEPVYTSVLVFGSIDPLGNGWLDSFLVHARLRERLSWVEQITQIFREADQKAKDSAWDRWLHRYLERRGQANPIPLDAAEAGAMSEWALLLKSHCAETVELLLAGPPPSIKGGMFYYRLHEAAVLDEAPVATARFLTALLSQEDGNGIWDLDQIHTVVARLIELDPRSQPCDRSARTSADWVRDRALEFRGHLR
jgi:hypothetical protein